MRELAPGQSCQISVVDSVTGDSELIYETTQMLFEAPNWTPDGWLVLNGDGRLWRLRPEPGAVPELIPLVGVPDLNNDHVVSPVAEEIFLSGNDWQIYVAPLAGGSARRLTADDDGRMHFLHGVSPDGTTLAYIGVQPEADGAWGPGTVWTMRLDGTESTQITSNAWSSDGSEYSPDARWIYLNTEAFSSIPGHAQIARVPVAGGELEQLTFDDRVNWFPHHAPDGRTIVYLSYPSGTVGHPADLPVELRLVRGGDWSAITTLVSLFGGQGTINVNSWAPDSRRLAFAAYPICNK
ncbi:biopolymer transporter Tol [Agromyces sp. ISL-38]|uniref:TolB family protein n=1 Tax=Agromyces sp. ISL-38 TaxID=2819107 RepID=UPI0027DEF47B|nr:biopolymer transporter Tol [Agromyces sp. ISL-38]